MADITKTPLKTGKVTNSIWNAEPFEREKFKAIMKDFEKRLGRDKCWLWPRKKNYKGYGEYHWYDRITKKRYGNSAPRISLEIHLGRPLGHKLYPCHRCPGVPQKACFNPYHIFEDTMAENILDNYYGVDRTTPEIALEIVRLRDSGMSFATVGIHVDMSPETVRNTYLRTKTSLGDDVRVNDPGRTVQSTQIDKLMPQIKELYQLGRTWVEIEDQLSIRIHRNRRLAIKSEL